LKSAGVIQRGPAQRRQRVPDPVLAEQSLGLPQLVAGEPEVELHDLADHQEGHLPGVVAERALQLVQGAGLHVRVVGHLLGELQRGFAAVALGPGRPLSRGHRAHRGDPVRHPPLRLLHRSSPSPGLADVMISRLERRTECWINGARPTDLTKRRQVGEYGSRK
jgi:hypothetical protein